MVKNSYDVSSPQVGEMRPKKKDNSFGSFMGVMFAFLVVCLLILSLKWYYGAHSKKEETDNKQYERIRGIPGEKTTRRIIDIEETTERKYIARTKITTVEDDDSTENTDIDFRNKHINFPAEETTTVGRNGDENEIISTTTLKESSEENDNPTIKIIAESTTKKIETETTTTDFTTDQPQTVIFEKTTRRLPESTLGKTTEEIGPTTINLITEETTRKTLDSNLGKTTEEIETTTIDSTTEQPQIVISVGTTRKIQTTTSGKITEEIETTTIDTTTEEPKIIIGGTTKKIKNSEKTTEEIETTTIDSTTEQSQIIISVGTTKKTQNSEKTTEEIETTTTNPTTEKTQIVASGNNVEKNDTTSITTKKIEITTYGTTVSDGKNDPKEDEENESNERVVMESQGIETTTIKSVQKVTKSNLDSLSLVVNDEKKCNSSKCALTAARIISSMDLSKTPCENFYGFACGGVQSKERKTVDVFSASKLYENAPDFVGKFKIFYTTCVKHEDRFDYNARIEKAKNLLSNAGLFQFDGQSNITYNVTEFIGNLILFKSMPFFEVDVDIDPENSTYILKILAPDLTSIDLEHWSTLLETKRKCLRETDENAVGSGLNLTLLYDYYRECQTNYSDYLDSIETSVRELGIFSNLTEEELGKHVKDIRFFIRDEILPLFDNMGPPPDLQESLVRRLYKNFKLKELNKLFPLIQWEDLVKMLINDHNINDETVIQMYNIEYFEKILHAMYELDKGKLNNALLAILANSLFENTVLPVHRHSRSEYCKKRSTELMPDIVNYLYKKIVPATELKEHNAYVDELYGKLRENFRKSLDKADWLTTEDEAKILFTQKLDKIQLAMFQNDDLENERKLLENYYNFLNLEENYQENLFELMKFRRRGMFSIQGQNVTAENMFRHLVDATKEEPVFFYANDIVGIPYGLSSRATKELPAYIILAQVGFPLAKIIGHAFDSVGIHQKLKLNPDASTFFSDFADNTRDVIRLSNPINFEDRRFYFTINNGLSENERMAENTALRLVTDSFNELKDQPLLPWIPCEFSREKVFFIAIAQEFCRKMSLTEFMLETYESPILPPQFRIENILGNSEEFWNQYNCPEGSTMTRIQDHLQFPFIPNQSDKELEYPDE